MKKIVVLMIAVFSMAVAVPAFAAEMTKEQKDQCLLASKGCAGEADTIQQKIKKLQAEIKKGNKAYSPEEIKKLNAKLKEAEAILDGLLRDGSPGK
jgi:peptidoglycan hydrolase CwlO-like protein